MALLSQFFSMEAYEPRNLSEDDLGNFIAECCAPAGEVSADCRELFGVVYNAFTHWYEAAIGNIKYCPKKKSGGN